MSLSLVSSSRLQAASDAASDGPLSMRPSALAGRELAAELSRIGARLAEEVAETPHLGAIVRGTASKAVYVACLTQFYHHVGVTVRHLQTAAATLRRRGEYAEIAASFRAHALEERGHERLAALDLRALGVPASQLAGTRPSRAVAAYKAINEHIVSSAAAFAYVGPAFVLEYLSARAAGEAEANLRQKSGIPGIDGALRFLHVHSLADGEHVRAWLDCLSTVRSPEDARTVLWAAETTARLFVAFVSEAGGPADAEAAVSQDEEETWPLASW